MLRFVEKMTVASIMICSLGLISCQNKGNTGTHNPNALIVADNGGQNTPQQPSNWQNYNNSIGRLNDGYLCGCPFGTLPVVHPQWGLRCAPAQSFNFSFSYSGYQYNSNLGQWESVPQVGFSSFGQNCYTQAVQYCNTQSMNYCGFNAACISVDGSNMGICQYLGAPQVNNVKCKNWGPFVFCKSIN